MNGLDEGHGEFLVDGDQQRDVASAKSATSGRGGEDQDIRCQEFGDTHARHIDIDAVPGNEVALDGVSGIESERGYVRPIRRWGDEEGSEDRVTGGKRGGEE